MTDRNDRWAALLGGRRIMYVVGVVALVGGGAFMLPGRRPAAEAETAARTTALAEPPVDERAPVEPGGVDAADAAAEQAPALAPVSAADFQVGVAGSGARMAKPAAVKGLYVNAWAAASSRKMEKLIGIADRTEVNAFVIDVKDATGKLSYISTVPLAERIGASERRVADIRGLLARLRERGIYPIARIVVFRDPVLAAARPDWAIRKADGEIWHDRYGDVWVDAFNRNVWDYNIAIAREALELGFSEVQWDYVRFPDTPARLMKEVVHPAQEGRAKKEAIREFMQYSRDQLADLGAPVTADVFGLTTSVRGDMGIGQDWLLMLDAIDVLLPMVYPSHYVKGSYGIGYPNGRPYETVKIALEHGVRRTEGVANAATIRPWLQDFTLGQPRYGPAEVRAQIRAVYDAGLEEWVLWNASSNYTEAALAPEGGRAPDFPLPAFEPMQVPEVQADTMGLLGEPVRNG